MFKKQPDSPMRSDSTAQPAALQPRRTPPMPEPGGPAGRLTVGPDIRLKSAAIEDCDTLYVEGRVEASMDSRVLQIEQSGTFVGAAKIDEAEIQFLSSALRLLLAASIVLSLLSLLEFVGLELDLDLVLVSVLVLTKSAVGSTNLAHHGE